LDKVSAVVAVAVRDTDKDKAAFVTDSGNVIVDGNERSRSHRRTCSMLLRLPNRGNKQATSPCHFNTPSIRTIHGIYRCQTAVPPNGIHIKSMEPRTDPSQATIIRRLVLGPVPVAVAAKANTPTPTITLQLVVGPRKNDR
jgi:hypothetical protein